MQLERLPNNVSPTAELRCELEPYMYEVGLDPDNLAKQPKVIVHGLMIYQVLDKRHLELDDLATGEN